MSTSTKKTSTIASKKKTANAPKAAPKKASKTAAPAKASVPAKVVAAKVPATRTPAKVPAKVAPKASAKRGMTSREVMLARVESVRLAQRTEGHFDCFGRAEQGYCDQGECAYHAECLSVSGMLHNV